MSSVITPPSSPATSATGELRRPKPLRMLWITAAFGACFVAIQWGLRDAPVLWFAALRAIAAGRLFAAITSNWRGRPLTSHQVVVDLIGATTTRTGITP